MNSYLDMIAPGPRMGGGNHGRVVEDIGHSIVAGDPSPGTLLPRDEELIEHYNVSRTVLREAMKTLAAKGMVVPKARVGTRVRPRREWNMFDAQVLRWHMDGQPSDSFYRQLYEMRLAFEPFAARLAAQKATADDLARLEACVAEMRAATEQTAFSLADMSFHKAIFDTAGNAFFHSVVSLVGAALQSLLRRSSPDPRPQDLKVICDSHQLIVDAIAKGDPAEAQIAMTRVIDVGYNRVFGAAGESTPSGV